MLLAEFPRPTLNIQLTETNTLLLTWPAAFGSGFVLQQASDLQGTSWGTNSAPVASINGTNRAVLPVFSTRQFYRLAFP